MTGPAENQQTVEALAEKIEARIATAETMGEKGLAISVEDAKTLVAALRDLVKQADAPVAEIRRLLDAYFGDKPESMEVAIAAQKIGNWLDGVAAGKEEA